MISDERVLEIITESGIEVVGPLVRDEADQQRVYAFIRAHRDEENVRRPSNFHLSKIAKIIHERGISLSFVITNDEKSDIEDTIKSALIMFFPDIVRNVFVAFSNSSASVWVEPKRAISGDDELKLNKKCSDLLSVLEIPFAAVRLTSSENLPTRTACLKAIRLKSPISREVLSAALTERGFHIPNDEWLSRMLDALRKAGLVARRKDGGFVLTYSALKNLGSAKNSRSPDISRALALARRDH